MERLPIAVSVVVALAGCTVVADWDRPQCDVDADCASFSLTATCDDGVCVPPADPLACLERPDRPKRATEFVLDFQVLRATTQARLPGASIRACRQLDVECVGPVAEATTDADGVGVLSLPPPATLNNDFYFEVEAEGYLPSLHYPYAGLFLESDAPATGTTRIDLVSADELALYASVAGTSWDEARGFVFAHVEDCGYRRLEGVSIAAVPTDPDSQVVYFDGGQLVSSRDRTDATGRGGFTNVPVGSVELTLTHLESQRVVDTLSVFSRPGWFTDVLVAPPQTTASPLVIP